MRASPADRSAASYLGGGSGGGAPLGPALFPIVGIGASAGGFDSVKRLFRAMPVAPGAGFVLVQHADPTRKRLTATLVRTCTSMPVCQAQAGMRIKANSVYVVPPNRRLAVCDGTLRAGTSLGTHGGRMAIDFFLASLAADQGERSVGIVLSGAGTDGMLGLEEIRTAGGLTITQTPGVALPDVGTQETLAGENRHHVLFPEQMADVSLSRVMHPASAGPSDVATIEVIATSPVVLHGQTGVDSSHRDGPREDLEVPEQDLLLLNERLWALNSQLESKVSELESVIKDLEYPLTSSNIAMLFLDRPLRIRRFTPATAGLFDLIPSDVGRPIRDVARKFTDPAFLSDILLVLEGGIASKKEVQSSRGPWYVRQTLPCLTQDGRIEGAVITFSDVAAEVIQEARLYSESIVNTVREPLLVLDGDLRVHSVNPAFSLMFGLSQEEVLGRFLYEVGVGRWATQDLQRRLKDVLRRKHELGDFEITHAFGDTGERTVLLNARALHRTGGRPELILLAMEDVTERRRIARKLRENETRRDDEERVRQRQLDLTNALRVSTIGELATGLAHELNQPLSAIANVVEASAQYVRAGTIDPPKLLELLDSAVAESLRAAGIVSHLRSFVEKGEPQLESVDLGEVVGNVPRLLLRDLELARIALRVDLSSGKLPVRADRMQIEQVIVNLIQNAIDTIEESCGDLRLIELSARAVKGMAEVSVRDTGMGVSADAARRMFEPFFTTKKHGLGMGLALSRSILETHHSRIWMEKPGDCGPGTVVRFAIPLQALKQRRDERPA